MRGTVASVTYPNRPTVGKPASFALARGRLPHVGNPPATDHERRPSTVEAPHITFDGDIKPLFRETDRDSMRRTFDLWSYDDVKAHAGPIARRLTDGRHLLKC
jgi:hypothetical protein